MKDARTVLIVDDSRIHRQILKSCIARWGYHIVEAESAEAGLQYCQTAQPDFVISDWMMPGMDGLEFCQAFRALDRDGYGYFILLTSKSETAEVVRGLDTGADDFLTKPVNGLELRARMKAGERILKMEEKIRNTHNQLQALYDEIDKDLIQARKIQDSLVPERERSFGDSRVGLLLKPCGHVGGDLVGMFSPGTDRLGFYSIDVSGHGITSAMMTARISGYLSGDFLDQNIALERRSDDFFAMREPEEVARLLNDRLAADAGVEDYFTMAYAVVDLTSGRLRMVQAGHPCPLVIRASGETEFVGVGGVPIGLINGAEFISFDVFLEPGDRVLFYSDGFTECETDNGMLEEDGLERLVRSCMANMSGREMLNDMFWRLAAQMQGNDGMADDVSAVLFEFGGA